MGYLLLIIKGAAVTGGCLYLIPATLRTGAMSTTTAMRTTTLRRTPTSARPSDSAQTFIRFWNIIITLYGQYVVDFSRTQYLPLGKNLLRFTEGEDDPPFLG